MLLASASAAAIHTMPALLPIATHGIRIWLRMSVSAIGLLPVKANDLFADVKHVGKRPHHVFTS